MPQKFEIQITTTCDPAGAQQASAALGEVGKGTEKAGEHAKVFNAHGREMHELFSKLNQLAPDLGLALKAAFNPEAAGIIGLVVVVELVSKLFEKIKRDAEEFEKTMAMQADFSGIKNSVESMASALATAGEKAKDFRTSMEEIMSAQQTIAQSTDALVSTLEHQKTVEDQIATAKKEQTAAELELMKAKGQITPEQYDRAKIKLESQSAREAAQRDVAYLQKEKQAEETARDTAAHNVENLGEQEKAAQERVATAENNLKQAEQRRAHAKDELDKTAGVIAGNGKEPGLQQKVDDYREGMYPQLQGMNDAELKDYLQKIKGAGASATMEEGNYGRQIEKYLELAGHLQDARQQQSGFAGKLRDSEGAIDSAKSEKSNADTALTELNKQTKDNADSVKTLTGKIEELTRKLDEHKDDSKVFDAQDRARVAQALPGFEKDLGVDSDSGIAAFVQKFFESQNRLQQHQGTAGDSQTVGAMNQLLSGTQQSDHRLFAIIQSLVTHVGNRDATLSGLEKQVAILRSAVPRGSPTGQ